MNRTLAGLILSVSLTTGAVAVAAAAQQASPDVCKLFSNDELTAVLGAPPSRPGNALMPGMCSWGAPGKSLMIANTDAEQPAQAIAMVEAVKNRTRAPEIAKEEPGLGQRAVSTIATKTVELYVANGTHLWRFSISAGDQKLDADAILPRFRAMAHKVVK